MVMWADKAARSRREWLARIERRIRRGNPRLLMGAIVAATASAGMLASALLHQGGMTRLWLRYGLSVAVAYGAFMFFVWLWIVVKRNGVIDDPGHDRADAPDADAVEIPAAPREESLGYRNTPLRRRSHSFDLPDVGDEGIIIAVVVFAAIAAAAAASLYVVIIAPQLLAEVLLDGVLATVIYRRLRASDRRHWLDSALSRTWIPVLVVAIFFVIAGAVCQWYAPEATTLTETLRHGSAP